MTRIAILADPHFHAVDFDPADTGAPYPALRTLRDSTESTRIFNESGAALVAALDDIVARGIELVVIAGDLTDDGQVFNWRAVNALLDRYRARGLRFYATPGNHDLFAMSGRHHAKRFLLPDGSSQLVSSAPTNGADIVTPEMFCPGYADVLPLMRDLGYARGKGDLLWETPFGADPAWPSRLYPARSADGTVTLPMVDASYLVEPVAGLWLLSLDANTYRPNGAAAVAAGEPEMRDCTEMGWNAALADKPHLLVWAKAVATRARSLGKTLITFSHYPVVDPLNGSATNERHLLGNTGFVRRMPTPDVASAFADAGIGVHFSGHWHINNTASHRAAEGQITNIAVPSLVAFPAAFKIIEVDGNTMGGQTIPVRQVPGFNMAFASYAAETAITGLDASQLLAAPDYGAFLDAHLAALVARRYLPLEWPAHLARLVPLLALSQVLALAGSAPVACAGFVPEAPNGGHTLFDLVVHWYALRKGADLAVVIIPPPLSSLYHTLIAAYAGRIWPDDSLQAHIATLLAIMQLYLDRHPSADFTLDLRTGAII